MSQISSIANDWSWLFKNAHVGFKLFVVREVLYVLLVYFIYVNVGGVFF